MKEKDKSPIFTIGADLVPSKCALLIKKVLESWSKDPKAKTPTGQESMDADLMFNMMDIFTKATVDYKLELVQKDLELFRVLADKNTASV